MNREGGKDEELEEQRSNEIERRTKQMEESLNSSSLDPQHAKRVMSILGEILKDREERRKKEGAAYKDPRDELPDELRNALDLVEALTACALEDLSVTKVADNHYVIDEYDEDKKPPHK